MTSYMNPQALEKAIKSIATRGAKLDADIQAAALSAINHLAQHGDAVFCGRLYNAMPKGSRRSALALWFTTFGGVAVNTDAKTKDAYPFTSVKGMHCDLEAAAQTQWFEMKKEPSLDEMFDIKAALASVLKKATRDGVKVNDPALLKALNTMVGDKPTPGKAVAAAQATLV